MTTKEDEKKERFDKLHEQLEAIADSYVADPTKIAEYLAFASKFYNYSPTNTMLIHFQNPGAIFVASYAAWKAEGHAVRKGEKGAKIFVPSPTTFFTDSKGDFKQLKEATKQEKQLIKEGKIESVTKMYFRIGHVFDIAQTNVSFTDYPKILAPGVTSVEHAELTKRLTNYIRDNVCDIEIREMSGARIFGFYDRLNNRIQISPALGDTARLSTLAHEMGHAVLHQVKNELTTAEKEFQADAFSIMLHEELGLPVTEDRKSHLSTIFEDLKKEVETSALKEKPDDVEKDDWIKSSYRRRLVESLKDIHTAYKLHRPEIMKALRSHTVETRQTDKEL